MKKYIVGLTSKERPQLQKIISKGNKTGYRIKYGLKQTKVMPVSTDLI